MKREGKRGRNSRDSGRRRPSKWRDFTCPYSNWSKRSAFPDVCCSFDLLLQLKLHLPSPPPCSLAASVTRVQGQRPHPPRSQRSDPPVHPLSSPSTPRSRATSLRSPHQTAPLPSALHQLTSLTTAAPHTTRPSQYLTHLAFNLRLRPSKPPFGPQCP